MRFARSVQFQLKTGKHEEFTRLIKSDILPLLKLQPGFKEEITLMDRDHGQGVSLWEDRASAETYQTKTYPQVLQKLQPMIEGIPKVEMFEVAATTLQY